MILCSFVKEKSGGRGESEWGWVGWARDLRIYGKHDTASDKIVYSNIIGEFH